MISVVIPISNPKAYFDKVRERVASAATLIEVIYVINNNLDIEIIKKYHYEKVINCKTPGRGHACSEAIRLVKGEYTIILHADTILPIGWDKSVINALTDVKVAGGGFSLKFDNKHLYLKFLIFLSNVFFRLTRELWGDRAIFLRSDILKNQLKLINVPIMEDVILSRLMNKSGKVVMLKEAVTTSADNFLNFGLLRHTFRIAVCRIWYGLGGNLEKVYNYYYS